MVTYYDGYSSCNTSSDNEHLGILIENFSDKRKQYLRDLKLLRETYEDEMLLLLTSIQIMNSKISKQK